MLSAIHISADYISELQSRDNVMILLQFFFFCALLCQWSERHTTYIITSIGQPWATSDKKGTESSERNYYIILTKDACQGYWNIQFYLFFPIPTPQPFYANSTLFMYSSVQKLPRICYSSELFFESITMNLFKEITYVAVAMKFRLLIPNYLCALKLEAVFCWFHAWAWNLSKA